MKDAATDGCRFIDPTERMASYRRDEGWWMALSRGSLLSYSSSRKGGCNGELVAAADRTLACLCAICPWFTMEAFWLRSKILTNSPLEGIELNGAGIH